MATKVQRASSTASRGTSKSKNSPVSRTSNSRAGSSRTSSRSATGSISRSEAGRRGAAARWGYSLENAGSNGARVSRNASQSQYGSRSVSSRPVSRSNSNVRANQGHSQVARNGRGEGSQSRYDEVRLTRAEWERETRLNQNRSNRFGNDYGFNDQERQPRERYLGRPVQDYQEEDEGVFYSSYENNPNRGGSRYFNEERNVQRSPRNASRNPRGNRYR